MKSLVEAPREVDNREEPERVADIPLDPVQPPRRLDIDARSGAKQLRQARLAVVARAAVRDAGRVVRLVVRVPILVVEVVAAPDDRMTAPAVFLRGRTKKETCATYGALLP